MNFKERAEDKLLRAAAVEQWPGLFDRLLKETGMSRAAFCKKHGLDTTQIGHQISGARGATWDHIHAVREALAAEGIEYIDDSGNE